MHINFNVNVFIMIKKVIHLADIHIPNLEEKRPYSEMLKVALAHIYKYVKESGCTTDEIRFVLAGDLYHNKIKTSNEAKATFHEFLNFLNAMGVVILFAGNHDLLEGNRDREDSISPTFKISNVYPNIKYLDKDLNYKSGYVVDDGIVWVLYSIHDKFRKPDIESLRSKYPDYKFIGLYHGEINGAVTDIGRTMEGGINTDDFSVCDCVMAGHIHKYQEIKRNGVPIVYAGSLFQQDSGENVSGHGFVAWDLETMSHTLHEIPNDYRIFHYQISSYEDIKNDNERLINP